jgi:hypothetical protein
MIVSIRRVAEPDISSERKACNHGNISGRSGSAARSSGVMGLKIGELLFLTGTS